MFENSIIGKKIYLPLAIGDEVARKHTIEVIQCF